VIVFINLDIDQKLLKLSNYYKSFLFYEKYNYDSHQLLCLNYP